LILLSIILTTGSFNLTDVVLAQSEAWFVLDHWPAVILFFVTCLAENIRHRLNQEPFDLPEAKAEVVAGYFTEYRSSAFIFIFSQI
jgi:NADH-quinone oxidoreductase subunit H